MSEVSYSSLLDHDNEEPQRERHENINNCASFPKRRPWTTIILTTCALVVVGFGLGVGYLAKHGAFQGIQRNVHVHNGTATEPNTGIQFPLRISQALDGTPQEEALVGLFLKARHVPEIEATLRVFVLAIYVEVTHGRRVLHEFRKRMPTKSDMPHLIELFSKGMVTVSGTYVMTFSPPGTHMYDAWSNSLKDLWRSYDEMTPSRFDALDQCFSRTFRQGFHTHDRFGWDWMSSSSSSSKEVVEGGGPTVLRYNLHYTAICPDPLFGRSLVSHELIENNELAVNMMWNLFDEQ